jgi:hypothetical protein
VKASVVLRAAVPRTSQKWDGWCSQWTSALGAARTRISPASGSESANGVRLKREGVGLKREGDRLKPVPLGERTYLSARRRRSAGSALDS